MEMYLQELMLIVISLILLLYKFSTFVTVIVGYYLLTVENDSVLVYVYCSDLLIIFTIENILGQSSLLNQIKLLLFPTIYRHYPYQYRIYTSVVKNINKVIHKEDIVEKLNILIGNN